MIIFWIPEIKVGEPVAFRLEIQWAKHNACAPDRREVQFVQSIALGMGRTNRWWFAMRSEDDLVYKLGDIIKASSNVRRCELEGAPAHVVIEFEQLPQVIIFVSPSLFVC
jgi:hypothetical protein